MREEAGLTPAEIEKRKEWLRLSPDDERRVKSFDPILQRNLDRIIEEMYAHFFSMDETRAFFVDEATLKRAKSAQRLYFARLTGGDYNHDYVQDRLRIGSTHYRIDLDPKWYMGAYIRVLESLMPLLSDFASSDRDTLTDTITAILKVVFFDMSLAMETYISAKEAAIKQHRNVIGELETERRVTKGILEDSPVGIVRLDDQLVCLECNQKFAEMLELSNRSEVVGRSLEQLCPQLDDSSFKLVLKSDQPYQATAERLSLNSARTGPASYFDWATWPIKSASGESSGLLAIFVNATERVLLQRQREDFVATLTHDLKTPIMAANRAVRLLLEGDFGAVTEAQAQVLQTIHESNTALYTLVHTLLDVYRYDSGEKKLSFAPHDLSQVIEGLVAELEPLANLKRISVIASLPPGAPQVVCDASEIRRVIQNLVDNSLKFTPAGGTVTISMECLDQETMIMVTDTGKGISEEDKPKLFERFWQAASSGRYYASTGLGLYLCRKIVEAHKGRIWCESTLGAGSRFAFTIGVLEVPDST